MAGEQNKVFVENAFWKNWGALKDNAVTNLEQAESQFKLLEPTRRGAMEYAAKVAQQQAEERRIDNLKLMIMLAVGVFAICLIIFLLSHIDMKSAVSSDASGSSDKKPIAQTDESSIEEEMLKGGFTSKEAYFSSELSKQTFDVGSNIIEFSKKMKSLNSKMNITGLVIAQKMDEWANVKTVNGFGVELIKSGDESDDVKLISHLKGMTSTVEFFAENGRVVTHFKDYPASYCAGSKGAAVCGS